MNRRSIIRFGVFVCLTGLFVLPGDGRDTLGDSEALRQEVLDEVRQYYADFSSRDWPKFADHFWPRATLATIWQPPDADAPMVFVSTVPEFVAEAPAGPDSKPIFEETMSGAEVRLAGALAQVWAAYDARFGDSGNVMEWSGIDAFTLLKHEGRWRIVSLAYVPDE